MKKALLIIASFAYVCMGFSQIKTDTIKRVNFAVLPIIK